MQVLVGARALAQFLATPTWAFASWNQLYVGATKSGGSVKISPIPDDVYELAEAVKVEVEPNSITTTLLISKCLLLVLRC